MTWLLLEVLHVRHVVACSCLSDALASRPFSHHRTDYSFVFCSDTFEGASCSVQCSSLGSFMVMALLQIP